MKRYLQFVFLLLIILLTVFVLGACLTWETLSSDVPTREQIRRITIDENDKTCVSAQDCVLAWTDCSTCECGTPINQQQAAKYEQVYEEICANYRGPVCDMDCPEVKLECINNLCTAVASPSAATPVQIFEGRYESAPDMSSFVPCGMDASPGSGQGYWLVPNDDFSRVYNKTRDAMIPAIASTYGPYDELAIYVRFRGVLSPSASAEPGGGYGHLHGYQREVKVTQMLEARYYLLPYSPCNH